jgi:hypothetical protein
MAIVKDGLRSLQGKGHGKVGQTLEAVKNLARKRANTGGEDRRRYGYRAALLRSAGGLCRRFFAHNQPCA